MHALNDSTISIIAERQVWDMTDGRCVHVLRGHMSTVRCVRVAVRPACAADAGARIAVSGARDATLRLWDLTSGDCLGTLVGHTAPVRWCVGCGRFVLFVVLVFDSCYVDDVWRHVVCVNTISVWSLTARGL